MMKKIGAIETLSIWIMFIAVAVLVMWGTGKFYADRVGDHVVIQPDPGIRCVVVSRMFNTSVDCWERKKSGYILD